LEAKAWKTGLDKLKLMMVFKMTFADEAVEGGLTNTNTGGCESLSRETTEGSRKTRCMLEQRKGANKS